MPTWTRRVTAVLLQALGMALLLFAIARALYYPFWAAGATKSDLARSWGGPTAVGATAAHWAVALVVGLTGWWLIRLGRGGRGPKGPTEGG